MEEENADVYIGFVGNDVLAHQLFDATFPILEESLLWVIPRLKQGQGWKFVTQFFSVPIWILSIVVIVVTAIAFRYFATTAGERDKKYKKLSECLLFIYSCFFNMGNNVLPKDSKLRIICIFLWPFTLNISTYLQGKMFGALTHPVYTDRVGDIEQLRKDLPLVVQENMLPIILRLNSSVSYSVIKSNRMSMEYDLQDVVRYQNMATIITQHILQAHHNFIPYIQPHEIGIHQVVLWVKKHRKFFGAIDGAIKRFVEHGMVKKIVSDMNYNHFLHCFKHASCWDGETQTFVVSAYDLRAAFFVLDLGIGIAAVLLLFEILYYNFSNKKTRNTDTVKI